MLALIAAMLAWPAAASSKKAGTSGAQFLRIGAGARATAMGDAFVGVADDVNTVYYNPGGLGFLKKTEFTAMHTQYIQGLNYDYGAYAQPLKGGALGLSAATLKTDDLTRRGLDESNLGSFQNQDSTYALSYGHPLGETLAVGLTARLVRQEIDTASAKAWAADFGILKHLEQRPVSLGFAVRHFGSKIKFNEESDPLPLTLDAGAAVDLFHDHLKLAGNLRHVRDSGLQYGGGAEWRLTLRDTFRTAVRGGYNSGTTDVRGASGMTLGAGAGYKLFDLDFAWVPFGDLGNTFRYSAHVKF